MRTKKKLVTAAAAAMTVVALTGGDVGYAETPDATAHTITGTLPDGSTYLFEVPANWNGTLLLYSHGYNAGPSNPARDAGHLPRLGLNRRCFWIRRVRSTGFHAASSRDGPGTWCTSTSRRSAGSPAAAVGASTAEDRPRTKPHARRTGVPGPARSSCTLLSTATRGWPTPKPFRTRKLSLQ
jgi:hypothetical protein